MAELYDNKISTKLLWCGFLTLSHPGNQLRECDNIHVCKWVEGGRGVNPGPGPGWLEEGQG